MRLCVYILTSKQLPGPINCSLLHNVGELGTTVKPISRVALECLVGHRVTKCIQNRLTDDVFGCN